MNQAAAEPRDDALEPLISDQEKLPNYSAPARRQGCGGAKIAVASRKHSRERATREVHLSFIEALSRGKQCPLIAHQRTSTHGRISICLIGEDLRRDSGTKATQNVDREVNVRKTCHAARRESDQTWQLSPPSGRRRGGVKLSQMPGHGTCRRPGRAKLGSNRPTILPPTDTCPPRRGGTLLQGDGGVCTAYWTHANKGHDIGVQCPGSVWLKLSVCPRPLVALPRRAPDWIRPRLALQGLSKCRR